MINILKSGGLGNNLFQFAFGLAVSKKLKTSFVFNTESLDEYFELGNYNDFFLKRKRYLFYLFLLKFYKWKVIDLNLDTKPDEILNLVENNAVLYGYFQSSLFFAGYEDLVKQSFKIKNSHLEKYQSRFSHLYCREVVCVAIRRKDYLSWHIPEIDYNTPELSLNYFKKTIDLIPDLKSKTLIVISDDIDRIKKELNFSNAVYIYEAIDAFISLTLANYLIISNSSFHWWGAWLNTKPGKIVYAPKYWLGHKVKKEYPKDIISPNWIQVEV